MGADACLTFAANPKLTRAKVTAFVKSQIGQLQWHDDGSFTLSTFVRFGDWEFGSPEKKIFLTMEMIPEKLFDLVDKPVAVWPDIVVSDSSKVTYAEMCASEVTILVDFTGYKYLDPRLAKIVEEQDEKLEEETRLRLDLESFLYRHQELSAELLPLQEKSRYAEMIQRLGKQLTGISKERALAMMPLLRITVLPKSTDRLTVLYTLKKDVTREEFIKHDVSENSAHHRVWAKDNRSFVILDYEYFEKFEKGTDADRLDILRTYASLSLKQEKLVEREYYAFGRKFEETFQPFDRAPIVEASKYRYLYPSDEERAQSEKEFTVLLKNFTASLPPLSKEDEEKFSQRFFSDGPEQDFEETRKRIEQVEKETLAKIKAMRKKPKK